MVDKHPVIASKAVSYMIWIDFVWSTIDERSFKASQDHILVLKYKSCKDDKLLISGLIFEIASINLFVDSCWIRIIIWRLSNINNDEFEDNND